MESAPDPALPVLGVAERAAAVVAGLVNHTISNRDGAVVGIYRCRRDVVVRKVPQYEIQSKGRPPGAVIDQFSFRARMRLLHMAKNCDVDFRSMLTVTYPGHFSTDGRRVKRDLNTLQKWLRRKSEDIRGLWFLEFQRRGAPHFHFLLSLCLQDQGRVTIKRRSRKNGHRVDTYDTCEVVEKRAAEAWYRIVGSGDERHLRAGVCWEVLHSEDAAFRYAAEHAAKPHQKSVPKEYQDVGRFWGRVGPVKLIRGEFEAMTTEQLFAEFGPDAMSSKGRVKKYLWDCGS